MDLAEIRWRTGYVPNAPITVKAAVRSWLTPKASDYPIALTLTLDQTFVENRPTGEIRRPLTRDDCERIVERFQEKLNRAVFGKRGAENYGMTLKYFPVLEGERSGKALHVHFAIGGLPKYVKFNEFDGLVWEAKRYVPNAGKQHKVDLADSGWLEYITKETATEHSDNVLWTHVT